MDGREIAFYNVTIFRGLKMDKYYKYYKSTFRICKRKKKMVKLLYIAVSLWRQS